jgi:uncharacterized protein YdaL
MKKLILLFSILFSLSATAQQYPIVLDIPDVVINETILKRKASLFTMTYNLGRQYVSLNWEVTYYAAKSDGAYGDEITFIPKYTKENVADNTVKVDSTGTIVYPDSSGNYPPGVIGQFDFFNNVAENVPVKVNAVIRQYGQNSKW